MLCWLKGKREGVHLMQPYTSKQSLHFTLRDSGLICLLPFFLLPTSNNVVDAVHWQSFWDQILCSEGSFQCTAFCFFTSHAVHTKKKDCESDSFHFSESKLSLFALFGKILVRQEQRKRQCTWKLKRGKDWEESEYVGCMRKNQRAWHAFEI